MNTTIRLAAVALALALAAPAMAQQRTTTGNEGTQLGLGAGISGVSSGSVLDTGALLFVPINIKQFRIEPFLGWSRSTIDASANTVPPPGVSYDGRASDFLVGVGGFLVKPVATQVQLYGGGRLGLEWQTIVANGGGGTTKWERMNVLLAAAAGGEYLPVPRVAFGAELQVGLVFFGDTKNTHGNSGASFEGSGGWGTATQATFFARFYLL